MEKDTRTPARKELEETEDKIIKLLLKRLAARTIKNCDSALLCELLAKKQERAAQKAIVDSAPGLYSDLPFKGGELVTGRFPARPPTEGPGRDDNADDS
jgi:hypothetical protein